MSSFQGPPSEGTECGNVRIAHALCNVHLCRLRRLRQFVGSYTCGETDQYLTSLKMTQRLPCGTRHYLEVAMHLSATVGLYSTYPAAGRGELLALIDLQRQGRQPTSWLKLTAVCVSSILIHTSRSQLFRCSSVHCSGRRQKHATGSSRQQSATEDGWNASGRRHLWRGW